MENKKQELIEKIEQEYANFKEDLMAQDKEEIVKRSLETVIKTFIKNYLINKANLTDYQVEALVEEDEEIISTIYESYIQDNDTFDFEEVLEDYILEILSFISEQEQE